MTEVWTSSSSDLFSPKACPGESVIGKNLGSSFAENVQGLSNLSLLSNNNSGSNSTISSNSEYSLFITDGLPGPRLNESTKSVNKWPSSDSLLPNREKRNDSLGFHSGFNVPDAARHTSHVKNDKDKLAAAIWANLPEPDASSKLHSKVVGAEIRQPNSGIGGIPDKSVLFGGAPRKNVAPPSIQVCAPASVMPCYRPVQARPVQLHQQLTVPNSTWNSTPQLVTILPAVQANHSVIGASVMQPRVQMKTPLVSSSQNFGHQTRTAIDSSGLMVNKQRQPQPTQCTTNNPTHTTNLTAPQLHSAIGQINELTVQALNQTAAMIMDRHQLESSLLHYCPENFRAVYNEVALPEAVENGTNRKESSGVDMLLTAQLRENLRINTLVKRIKVVTQISPSANGVQALEKWTENVRSFQSFLMKMHERARRMHLSSTIAATLYSGNDLQASRANDAMFLANLLNELMTNTLVARQALFQLGERTIMLLSQSVERKPFSASRSHTAKHHIPVNPKSAQELWCQLGQTPFAS